MPRSLLTGMRAGEVAALPIQAFLDVAGNIRDGVIDPVQRPIVGLWLQAEVVSTPD